MFKRRRLMMGGSGGSSGGAGSDGQDVTIDFWVSYGGTADLYTGYVDNDGWPVIDEFIGTIGSYDAPYDGGNATFTLKSGVTYILYLVEGCYHNEFTIDYENGDMVWMGENVIDIGKQTIAYFTCEVGMTYISFFGK